MSRKVVSCTTYGRANPWQRVEKIVVFTDFALSSIFLFLLHMSSGNFYPYENLLGTTLHELVHMEIGPHSAKFYKMLDQLTDECDKLIREGLMSTTGSKTVSDLSVLRLLLLLLFLQLPLLLLLLLVLLVLLPVLLWLLCVFLFLSDSGGGGGGCDDCD